ncbi:tetratricopeptide repeat protein [Sideroxydans lithotrophicus]|uniref:tetratricopeptide repeat protein n=1 Tax=Sideroxydans lithotrophicus TaxID=63745 RepID=UPI0001B0C255|nr:tetratricopeptide repeat protein [Sideroxydans lithotrophicus]
MKRALLLSLLALCAANAQANGFWDDLWHNADQQGERLMHEGKAAAAAQTYRDPRRKAFAELQAGDYANAAKHLSAFDDSDGNYNRGNALAQSGQLQEALQAYDAALARDPDNRDARHNRELVAKALQQQPPQPQSAANNQSSSKDDKNGGNKQAGQSGSNSGKQGDSQKNSGKQDPSGQNQSGKAQQGKTGQGQQPGSNNKKNAGQGQQQSAQANANEQPGASGQTGNRSQADDAAQARRDAEAALGKSPTSGANAVSDAPVSEQQLAQEQWLRRIPDDPGGLLRRKFMIEHMIRQQGGQQ